MQTSFVDMENMFELLEDTTRISDAPDASPLIVNAGKIEFRNVNFSYLSEYVVISV